LNTDWGLRDVSNDEKIYDGMSYHQGSVWPLFTGWAALAEYRGGQPLAGYQMLMENANLTRAQDLGADTELLSGDFFVPFGRSTSHQLWSSAMVITPTLRGLFGIDVDAQTKTITVNPHLPADWDHAAVNDLQVPGGKITLTFEHEARGLVISISQWGIHDWVLRTDVPGFKAGEMGTDSLILPLPVVEIGDLEHVLPAPGARTTQPRVLTQTWGVNKVDLTVQGMAGTEAHCAVRRHKLVKLRPRVSDGLSNEADSRHPGVSLSGIDTAFRDANLPLLLSFYFPPGEGWKTITVTITW
jgi:hypothetical protein